MSDEPISSKATERDLAFIGSAVDQLVVKIRDTLLAANDNGVGFQLNDEIEAAIDALQESDSPVGRILGDLMEIGHCTVLDSLGKSILDGEKK